MREFRRSFDDHFFARVFEFAFFHATGCFENSLEVGEIRYVGMTDKGKVVATEMTDELREATWDGLVKLLRHYRRADTGFTARRAMMLAGQPGDYDLLSRFGEWDLSAPAQDETVGAPDAG